MNQSILRKLANGHQTLGIEITDSQVKVCEVQQKGKKELRLLNYASAPLQAGIVDDGKVIDKVKLQEALKSVLESKRFTTKYVHFAIPSQMVMVRSLKLPDIINVELKKLVQFEMKNNLSMAFDDPSYDFIKLPKAAPETKELPPEEDNLRDVLVVAASTSILQDYVDVFEQLKLIPCSIEIKSFSLLRLAEWGRIQSEGIHLLVHVNELSADITIIEDGQFKLMRNVEVSFKTILSETSEENNAWLNSFSSPEQTYLNAVQDLIGELERLMNFYYYNLNKGERTFSQIWLTGDVPNIEKLTALMDDGLTPPVSQLMWDSLPVAGNAGAWSVPAYAVPLGLALRGKEA
ncbi:type IV pilus assembly protein PilM [Paenibacillus endophyticus]|uniref:Type IV pilus assembly protein PilM n=1 Tax=Paenibacillus endophyticus TaxID=1294268 RepID=A0A7W5G928_9BACL|nr:pilus assembly protein PilM [Paenibacillus endophyticus]MBB3151226.1 type IV pilus assembly protein PilM [Paenibacillus endophyticus]